VIERTFGVLKRRFSVLARAQEYSLDDQARLVSALAVIHNFIRIYDPNDEAQALDGDDVNQTRDKNPKLDECVGPADERGRATERRDKIARAMWRQYRHTDPY
jgi:hypothetical protein